MVLQDVAPWPSDSMWFLCRNRTVICSLNSWETKLGNSSQTHEDTLWWTFTVCELEHGRYYDSWIQLIYTLVSSVTWLAGKSPTHGDFNRNITFLGGPLFIAMFDYQRVPMIWIYLDGHFHFAILVAFTRFCQEVKLDVYQMFRLLPSGKHTQNYGNSHLFHGKMKYNHYKL